MIDIASLLPLLDRLSDSRPPPAEWRGWRIAAVPGGANNRLLRATGAGCDLAIKWTIRDSRRRALREWQALRLLSAGEPGVPSEHRPVLAPAPIYLDEDRYPQPVVVQSWLAGDVLAGPPSGDAEWQALAAYYAALHAVAPPPELLRGTITATSLAEAVALIDGQLRGLPAAARPPALPALLRRLTAGSLKAAAWAAPSIGLCRVDANFRNFLRRPGGLASVDWENSGWGDPAFELAELITHPAYLEVGEERWAWLIDAYCAASQREAPAPGVDRCRRERIATYRRVMLVWWVVRLARSLYEVPLGRDRRLAARPPGWQADQAAKQARYAALAAAALG